MAGSQAVLQNVRASKGGNQAGPLNQEVPGVVPSGRDNPGNENPTDFATHGSETISGDGSGAIDTTESTARRGGGSSGENGARNRRTGATGKKMADSRGANLINLARNTLGPLTDFGPNGAGVYVIRGMSTAGGAALRASAGAEIAAVNAQAAELNIAGFEQSAAARGYGLHAGRMSQYADFDAQEASWQAQNRFAGQMAGMTAAMGVLAGSLDPGAKPKSAMGMAMAGMLDSDAQQSAKKRGWFAGEGGAFWGMSDSLKTTLDNNVGGQAIGDAYEVYSARQLLEAGAIGNINQAGQVFGVSDGNNTVNTTGTKALEHIKSSRENPGITGSRNSRVPDSLVNSSTAAAAKFNDNNFKKSFDI
ncbi:MAG: hypothetical protein D6719_00010 [Candidatus Dadabacteria bacterium]|nr:MAG: hypothetical protein D6719_00010 [Candidatus Dadabacteria bacterium]